MNKWHIRAVTVVNKYWFECSCRRKPKLNIVSVRLSWKQNIDAVKTKSLYQNQVMQCINNSIAK